MNSLFQSLFLAVVVTMSSTQAMASAHVRKLFQVGPDVTVAPHREYIVTFDKQAVHNAAKKVEQLGRHDDWKSSGVQVIRTYEAGLKGVALRHATDDVLELLERDPHVQTIEPNVGGRLAAVQNDLLDWGLDRIDQPSLPEDGTYTYTSTGQRVRVFVLDSGLRLTHNEFQGPQPQHYQRAVCGFDKMEETDIPCQDLNNHGTMVAGIVGGETTGVAKKASIVSVKVMDKNRPWSVDVIEGLGYVLYQKQRHPTIPMVVMMAITFPRFFNATQEYFDAFSNHTKYSNTTFVPSAEAVATHNPDQVSAMDKITAELIAANVTVVVAAGNVDGGNTIRDSCLFSPITVPGVITVGATNKRDEVSSLSFTGPCVDLYAPGREITSANADDDESYAVSSGTSYAAPFVAGVAARMLEQNPSWTPLDITDAILENTIQTKEGLPLLNFVEASPPPQQQEQQQRPACRFVGLISDILCSNP